jgi:hypothetical protein
MHSMLRKGLIHVVYAVEADMMPERQRELLATLEHELAHGPVALLFSVPQAAGVNKAVPTFWLEVTQRHAPNLCAMAIVSPSMVVRTAAHGFSVANKLRRVSMAVQAFTDERLGERWASEQLERALGSASAGAAHPG